MLLKNWYLADKRRDFYRPILNNINVVAYEKSPKLSTRMKRLNQNQQVQLRFLTL